VKHPVLAVRTHLPRGRHPRHHAAVEAERGQSFEHVIRDFLRIHIREEGRIEGARHRIERPAQGLIRGESGADADARRRGHVGISRIAAARREQCGPERYGPSEHGPGQPT
jgi:hypothetical protein